jgi:hypothetical protein
MTSTRTRWARSTNYITFAEDGAQSEKWNGVDITANSRFKGIQIQGGLSTGRSTTDNCGVVAKLPEILGAGVPREYCHFQEPFPHAGEVRRHLRNPQDRRAVQRVVPKRPPGR